MKKKKGRVERAGMERGKESRKGGGGGDIMVNISRADNKGEKAI
jgi:hypothetical protein